MNSRTKRYQRLLRQVARELDERPTTEMVKHVATLRLMRENLQITRLVLRCLKPRLLLAISKISYEGDAISLGETFRRYRR